MRTEAKVMTIGQLCQYLRLHHSTIYRLLRRHQLPCFKIGNEWRFNVEAIDRWRMQQSAALNEISQHEAEKAEIVH
jgi:excisionase family DNA binding protein